MNIATLLAEMKMRGAADLYLSAEKPPVFRIDGTFCPADSAAVLAPQEVETLLEPYMTPEQKQAAWGSEGVRGVAIEWEGVTVEGQVFTDGGHLAAALHRVG